MKIVMIGLGRMDGNMARCLSGNGHAMNAGDGNKP